ncbi:MAG: PRC-barrel domain-containing protein [Mycobacterium sp.]|uniref:PRC-barrel domain-containing protein n=1 Tax=Mycobacterium sp. TaxID=1785 RepID=UPI003BB5FFC0
MTVDNATDDMRGRKVTDKDGKDVGKVQDVFVDDRERKARFLLVEHGGFLGIGEKKSFLPVDAITWTTSDDVSINDTRDHIAQAPGYDPELVNDSGYQSSIYGYYGCAPYWSAGYAYPGFNL